MIKSHACNTSVIDFHVERKMKKKVPEEKSKHEQNKEKLQRRQPFRLAPATYSNNNKREINSILPMWNDKRNKK